METPALLLLLVSVGLRCAGVRASEVTFLATTLDKSELLQRQSDPTVHSGIFDWKNSGDNYTVFTVDDTPTDQAIYGYGGALTQSSAYLLSRLKSESEEQYWSLMYSFFNTTLSDSNTETDHWSAMKVLRLPISASDYSLGNSDSDYWTYDDNYSGNGDWSLNGVSLNSSIQYVIPVLKDMLSIQPEITVMVCAWSAPVWMKTSHDNGPQGFYWGELLDSAYDTYAEYLWKVISLFQDDYAVNIEYLSLQNEPLNEPNNYPVMRMDAESQARLAISLYHTRQQLLMNDDYHHHYHHHYSLSQVKLVIYDHNWDQASYPNNVLNEIKQLSNEADEIIASLIAGAAFHCYSGQVWNQSVFTEEYPNKEVFFTECSGYGSSDFETNIPWNTDNLYKGSVDYGSTMVLHWNLVLDQNSDPHNGGCDDCRGIVTIDTDDSWKITFNEEYYGLAHYGRFVSKDGQLPTRLITNVKTYNPFGCDSISVSSFITDGGTMTVNVNNFCSDSSTKNVVIQRTDVEEYTVIQAVNGLNTLCWTL